MRTLLILLSGTLCTAQNRYFTTTLAGTIPPRANPVAVQQYFGTVVAVAYDPRGNLYYSDGNQIWRLNPDGTDTLIAGAPFAVPLLTAGTTNGMPLGTVFAGIQAMTFDPQGNLYIADGGIWKLSSNQQMSVLLPFSNVYFPDGATMLTTDSAGNLFAGGYNSVIVIEYAASGSSWSTISTGLTPSADLIISIAASGSTLYLTDYLTSKVFALNLQSGSVTTALQASVGSLAVGPGGVIFGASSSQIFEGNPTVSTAVQSYAGGAAPGYTGDGGPATQATIFLQGYIFSTGALAVNPLNGDLAFADQVNDVFRVIGGATHLIQTVAGQPHFGGDKGPAALARFSAAGSYAPGGANLLSTDSAGNLYVFDYYNARIRKITTSGIISTVAGNGILGNSGDGGPATQASISGPIRGGGIAVDKAGNLYFVNSGAADTIRMVDSNGIMHTVAGGGSAAVTAGVSATGVELSNVFCVAVDPSGNLFIGQGLGQFATSISGLGQILKVSSGSISIFAGINGGGFGNSPDGASAATSSIGIVTSMAVDSSGLVYFADDNNSLVRMVNAQGNLVTIAGFASGEYPNSPIAAGPAKSVALNLPNCLAVDSAGKVYFCTNDVDPQLVVVDTSGNLTPIAGVSPGNGKAETSGGDGGDSLQASFTSIVGVALDSSGSVYVLDSGAQIRKLSPYNPSAPPPYLLSGGVIGSGASLPPVAAVSPNGDATIYGGNFGVTHTLAPSDLVSGNVPTTLAGICVSFGGVEAAMLGVYPSQINVQVPSLPPGPVTVQVTLNCGKSNTITTNFGGVVVQTASPEFFTFLPDPVAGNNPIAAVNALTGALIGSAGLISGATFVPVKAGDIVEAYGTGWGSTTPAFGLGVIPGAAGQLASPYSLTFGGIPVPAANIQYAGVAPCCAGLYQINFTVPSGTLSGNQKLVITVGGFASPPNAYITVN